MNPEETAAIAVLIGGLIRTLKSDKAPAWVRRIPKSRRPLLAFILGVLAGALDAVSRGTPWKQALPQGIVGAALAVAGHELLVEGSRDGKEIGGGGGTGRTQTPMQASSKEGEKK